MTTAQRETVLQRVGRILDERIQLVRWHRQKACEAHGLPFEDGGEIRVSIDGGPVPATAATSAQPTTGAFAIPGWLKALALAAGTGAAGYGISEAMKADPPAVVEEAPQGGSLLQDLEDRGFHLPGTADAQ